jgi:hypothetical protein
MGIQNQRLKLHYVVLTHRNQPHNLLSLLTSTSKFLSNVEKLFFALSADFLS